MLPPESPCLKQCKLDDAGQMCVSCYRLLNEIAGWARLSAAEQWAVVQALPERRAHADAPLEEAV